jgi:hypothetical protein
VDNLFVNAGASATEFNTNPLLTPTQRQAQRKEKRATRKAERIAKRDAKKQARADKKSARVAKREGRKADRQYKREIRRTERLGIPFTGWDMPGAPSYHERRYVPEGSEYQLGGGLKEIGWQHLLTQSEGSNKHAGSARYEMGVEAYSTQETRKEDWNQSFMVLNPHPNTPTLNPSYKQMFRQMLPKGDARKSLRKYL